MRTIAIVPAAGYGKRLGSRERKPFIRLAGKPLIVYALKALGSSACIDKIIAGVDASSVERLEKIIKKYDLRKIAAVVKGGRTRSETVRNCFKAVKEPCDVVLIHDGARPFLSKELIGESVDAAKRYGASIAAIRQTDTVKLADKDNFIRKTLDRSGLWRAQTPQAFRYEILKKAFARAPRAGSHTDDASLVEKGIAKVKIIEGSARNIKITTREDLKIAEVLL